MTTITTIVTSTIVVNFIRTPRYFTGEPMLKSRVSTYPLSRRGVERCREVSRADVRSAHTIQGKTISQKRCFMRPLFERAARA